MIHSTRQKWRIAYEWARTFDGTMVPEKWDCHWDVLRDLRKEYPQNAWSIFGMFLYARELLRIKDRLKKKHLDSLRRALDNRLVWGKFEEALDGG